MVPAKVWGEPFDGGPDDVRTLSVDAPGFTTIRACRHCGVLVTGGPTACAHCVRLRDEAAAGTTATAAPPETYTQEDIDRGKAQAEEWRELIAETPEEAGARREQCVLAWVKAGKDAGHFDRDGAEYATVMGLALMRDEAAHQKAGK